jgi:hypothetical protein
MRELGISHGALEGAGVKNALKAQRVSDAAFGVAVTAFPIRHFPAIDRL